MKKPKFTKIVYSQLDGHWYWSEYSGVTLLACGTQQFKTLRGARKDFARHSDRMFHMRYVEVIPGKEHDNSPVE